MCITIFWPIFGFTIFLACSIVNQLSKPVPAFKYVPSAFFILYSLFILFEFCISLFDDTKIITFWLLVKGFCNYFSTFFAAAIVSDNAPISA